MIPVRSETAKTAGSPLAVSRKSTGGGAAALIRRSKRDIRLQVDGGVDPTNAGDITAAGADVLVAGNSVFSGGKLGHAIRRLRKAAGEGT